MRSSEDDDEEETMNNRTRRARKRIRELAKGIVLSPIRTASTIAPMPQAVASVLKDATLNALDLAVDEGAFSALFAYHDDFQCSVLKSNFSDLPTVAFCSQLSLIAKNIGVLSPKKMALSSMLRP